MLKWGRATLGEKENEVKEKTVPFKSKTKTNLTNSSPLSCNVNIFKKLSDWMCYASWKNKGTIYSKIKITHKQLSPHRYQTQTERERRAEECQTRKRKTWLEKKYKISWNKIFSAGQDNKGWWMSGGREGRGTQEGQKRAKHTNRTTPIRDWRRRRHEDTGRGEGFRGVERQASRTTKHCCEKLLDCRCTSEH